MTVCRLCENRGINTSYSCANAARVVVTPESETMVAAHAQKGELRLGDLTLSEQVDLIRWHSQPSEDVEPMKKIHS